MDLEAVVFDVDGTLVDSVDLHARCWRRAFARFGKDVDLFEVRAQIGKGADQLIPEFLRPGERERWGRELDEYRSWLWKRSYLHRVVAFPGVRALFERIRADGKRIALATSSKEDELAHYVELTGVAGLIDTGTSADDADKSKPHPDIFEAALRRLRLADPSRAIAVGDTPWDGLAAARADLPAVGVLTGGWPADALRRAGFFAVYVDPQDLLDRYEDSPIHRPEMYRQGTPMPELVP